MCNILEKLNMFRYQKSNILYNILFNIKKKGIIDEIIKYGIIKEKYFIRYKVK